MDFTSWDAGLHTGDQNYLEQHGIKGMKWGVRRFQNEDGSLTKAGEKRYGMSSNGPSARKMQKHFNKLDQSYANVEHRRKAAMGTVRREMRKANRKGVGSKGYDKHQQKALQAAKAASLNNQQKKAIESLQWKIIGKAAKKGYTTRSEAVVRNGERFSDKVFRKIGAGDFGTKVDGQQVSIRKRGNGGSQVINYRAGQSQSVQDELMRKRRMATAGAYR